LSESKSTSASLRVHGETLVPDEVSQVLKLKPDRSHVKGDVLFTNDKGLERLAVTGLWQLSTVDILSWNLDSQINEILGRATLDLAVWTDLTARFQADMFCGVFPDFAEKFNNELRLKPATLKSLSDRGLELTLDIYQPSVVLQSSERGK
jgi:hypothetical protein